MWENFYLEWLTKGQNILVVYYEDLVKTDSLMPTIRKMMTFMNFTIDEDRLNCVSKFGVKGNFYQAVRCVRKRPNDENVDYIYSKKHVKWINSAIRKVNRAIKDRGFDDTHLRTYENTNVKLNYCI